MHTGRLRQIKRFFTMFLLAVILVGEIEPLRALAGTDEELTTVRVAYPIMQNFQEGGEGEKKSGYSYEYLQKVAYYAGWKYEYVYGDFQDLLEKLENGEIDLMAGLAYTPERAERMDYSELSMGEERFYIFGKNGQDALDRSDLSSFDGKKIGVHTGCYAANLLEEWCGENSVNVQSVEYTDTRKCLEALESGDIDGVADSENYLNNSYTPVIYLGRDDYSFCVSKDRPDLLEQLDQAMRQIRSSNFFYEDELRVKYLSYDANATLPLSGEEQAWLEENPNIRIGYMDALMPYCETNDSGQAEGMLVDLMEHIREIYDMDYELVPYGGYEELSRALADGEVDAIFPVDGEYYVGETEQMMISDPATVSTMTLLNSRSAANSQDVAAVTRTSPFQQYVVQNYYPDTRVIYCDSIADCIRAVLDGEADFTMMETAIMNERVESSYRHRIQTVELPVNVNISFGVKTGDRQLLAILNKSISMEQSKIDTSLIQHSQTHVSYTVKDFVQDHIVLVLAVVIVVFAVIIALLFAYFRVRLRSEHQLIQAEQERRLARWSAQHDGLTGLLNRTAYEEVCDHLANSTDPIAMLLIDVDQFKKVNDTYGHEVGDRALKKTASLLEHFFRDEDFVIRFAGDEFVVMILNAGEEDAPGLQQKIRAINDILQQPGEHVPKISVSAGIAFSPEGYQDALFRQADKALYTAKANGRCGSFIYKKIQKEGGENTNGKN